MDEIIIYDFLQHSESYCKKCYPYIRSMLNNGVLKDLLKVLNNNDEINEFRKTYLLSESDFNIYDIKLLKNSKNLIKRIINNIDDALQNLNRTDLISLTKLIAKKYLLCKNNNKPNVKVSCNIFIENLGKLVVNCYHTSINNYLIFKSIKGSIYIDESEDNAIKREIKEELNLNINKNLELIDKNKNKYGIIDIIYKLELSIDEFNAYVNLLNINDIDVEITQIKIIPLIEGPCLSVLPD